MHELETIIGYAFRDPRLLALALTHRSLARERDASNQRLEFLGDAVLGLVIAEMLYRLFPEEAEGDLSKRMVSLVNGEQLTDIALLLNLPKHVRMSEGEAEQGGRANPSHLEDACEALLGAVYLDGGLSAAQAVIEKFWRSKAQGTKAPPKDPKTTLQEWAQAKGLPLPEYTVISAEGPSHAPYFIIEVSLYHQPAARGEAGTKRMAERLAAAAMLMQLGL